jgi:NAD(P)-dependent dehydrogenase (short-subunit alcohol dehydrogenase family)
MNRVADKIALITGGASGIGRATAKLLAAEGARVAVSDINIDGAQATAADIGNAAIALEHDVTGEASWAKILAKTEDKLGGLHVLVNCAGIVSLGTVEETTLEDWRRVHAVDLDSVFLGCKLAVPAIARYGGGSIINMSSISGIIAGHNLAAYNSAKAGVRHLTKSVALHCARQGNGIRCNSVHPAFIDTAMLDDILRRGSREEGLERLARQVPLGKVGDTNDVAWAIVYLASDESKFMTGAEMVLDGGASAM